MRGGDFWQGAAAGFVSSLMGSGAQSIGIHGWGMVGVSAASGGVGAAIAGGSAEEILFGIVQGAMVGALNHAAGEKKENTYEKQLEKLLKMSEGTIIKGNEMNKYYPDASLAFNKISSVKGGIEFDVKTSAKIAMIALPSKVSDKSIAYLSKVIINDSKKGKIDVIYMNSPKNILRNDPMVIYINDNSYRLKNQEGVWYKLGD